MQEDDQIQKKQQQWEKEAEHGHDDADPTTATTATAKEDWSNGEENVVSVLAFRQLLSYADAWDWVMMAAGTLGSVIHGLAQPIGYYLLGKALDAYGNNISDTEAMVKALVGGCLGLSCRLFRMCGTWPLRRFPPELQVKLSFL